MEESDQELVGKIGHVTGEITPGSMGDVMVPIRGGSESYYAYSSDPAETIPKGARVLVLDQQAPRTIIVSRY
jgi:hypothetical protein